MPIKISDLVLATTFTMDKLPFSNAYKSPLGAKLNVAPGENILVKSVTTRLFKLKNNTVGVPVAEGFVSKKRFPAGEAKSFVASAGRSTVWVREALPASKT